MTRRALTVRLGMVIAGLCLAGIATGWAADDKPPVRHILFLSKSSGFEHTVIKSKDGQPSYVDKVLKDLGPKSNLEFTCTKDGSVFTPENIAKYDAFMFYTTGDLTSPSKDGGPAMTPEGKAAFLDAIKNGKGFIGVHSATDTFHSPGDRMKASMKANDQLDPYVEMIGAEFIHHGKQQKAKMICADPKFPGMSDSFELMDEWYTMKNYAKNLHVLLVQETAGMEGDVYKRGPFPATWARMYGKGRVFYTSIGHREDVWTNPTFQKILLGGIQWVTGGVDADVTPNLEQAAPKYAELPPEAPAKEPAKKKK